jgi:type IV pilus assembly protein PilV
MRTRAINRRRTAGFTMIEILVSLLVMTFGVLALVGLQANAVRLSTDARDRGVATFLADQLLGRLLIADPAVIATVAHNPGGTLCSPSGSVSTSAVVNDWLAEVSRQLPNAPASDQQVIVRNAAQGDIDVVLCWKRGNDAGEEAHSLTVRNRVQW